MKYKHLTLLMLGFCSVADAQEAKPVVADVEKAAPKASEEADKIADLIKEANEVQGAFMKKVQALAKTDRAKAMKMYQEERPDMKPVLKQILDLAKKDPKSESSAKGLAWGYGAFQAEEQKEALGLLMEHHQDNAAMLKVVANMPRSRTPNTDALEAIIKDSKNDKLRQMATASLASVYDRAPDKKEDALALYKQLAGWPNIAETNPKLLADAKQKIFVAENLSIGKVAPDIVGTDEEDKEFKLSDYRGKVVMIDFWGIW